MGERPWGRDRGGETVGRQSYLLLLGFDLSRQVSDVIVCHRGGPDGILGRGFRLNVFLLRFDSFWKVGGGVSLT